MDTKEAHAKQARRAFAVVAVWQFATFVVLLLLIWVNEIFDLPSIVYGEEPGPPSFLSASLLSAFVVLTAIITVGQTHVKQQRILAGFLTICANCHKVRVYQDVWQAIEEYVSRYCPVEFSHGLCPDCFTKEMSKLGTDSSGNSSTTSPD